MLYKPHIKLARIGQKFVKFLFALSQTRFCSEEDILEEEEERRRKQGRGGGVDIHHLSPSSQSKIPGRKEGKKSNEPTIYQTKEVSFHLFGSQRHPHTPISLEYPNMGSPENKLS